MDNNKDLLQIKIDEAKAKLSEEIKNAITAINWRETVLGMREKKGYSFSQLEDLEIQTELLLYGLIKPEEYEKELESLMKISKEETVELINDLNTRIFQKIREELIKNSGKKIPKPIEIKIKTNEEKDDATLNQSGIQVIKEVTKEEKPEMVMEKREDMLSKVENPTTINPAPKKENSTSSFIAQKLSGSFQIPSKETQHIEPSIKNSFSSSQKTDPYREALE